MIKHFAINKNSKIKLFKLAMIITFFCKKLFCFFQTFISNMRKLHMYIECFINKGTVVIQKKSHLYVPLRCDGRGKVFIGSNVTLGFRKASKLGNGENLLQARSPNSTISIGSKTLASNNIAIIANNNISIGENCRIGEQVSIYDCDFHEINPEFRDNSFGKCSPVIVGNNVWIGSRVIILKGVIIGDNSIIAAGSIVTTNIPKNKIAGGNPARIIKGIF